MLKLSAEVLAYILSVPSSKSYVGAQSIAMAVLVSAVMVHGGAPLQRSMRRRTSLPVPESPSQKFDWEHDCSPSLAVAGGESGSSVSKSGTGPGLEGGVNLLPRVEMGC